MFITLSMLRYGYINFANVPKENGKLVQTHTNINVILTQTLTCLQIGGQHLTRQLPHLSHWSYGSIRETDAIIL